MPITDRQRLITEIVATVLYENPRYDKFPWFQNKHRREDFGIYFPVISAIFKKLNGDLTANQNKRTKLLDCDAYFGGEYNFIFEFDEFQHFSSYRLQALECYPNEVDLAFDTSQYKFLCNIHKENADSYRRAKTTVDFNFIGGRTAQRAYLDCFRDLLPSIHGLNPTLRITEFETAHLYANNRDAQLFVASLIKKRLTAEGLKRKIK